MKLLKNSFLKTGCIMQILNHAKCKLNVTMKREIYVKRKYFSFSNYWKEEDNFLSQDQFNLSSIVDSTKEENLQIFSFSEKEICIYISIAFFPLVFSFAFHFIDLQNTGIIKMHSPTRSLQTFLLNIAVCKLTYMYIFFQHN